MRATSLVGSAGRTIVAVSSDAVVACTPRAGVSHESSSARSWSDHPRPVRNHHVAGDQHARLAGHHAPHALNDRAQRDDGADADGQAHEEEQQALPRRARLAKRHAQDEHHAEGASWTSRQSIGIGPAIAQRQLRAGLGGQAGVVGDQHQRGLARAVHVDQQVHDVPAVGAVEIAGRLVGQQDRRIVGQGACDGHALLLAARQLRRIVMPAIAQAHFVQQRVGPPRRIAAAGQFHRHQHVLARGQRRESGGRTERRTRSCRPATAPGRLRPAA